MSKTVETLIVLSPIGAALLYTLGVCGPETWRSWRARRVRSCECGNRPLTEADGDRCRCCREGHLTYHDDLSCRRCGCPIQRSDETTHKVEKEMK